MKFLQRGYTLIELLVVVAIIEKKDGSDDYLYAEFNLCEF
jgi:hypothetical protein